MDVFIWKDSLMPKASYYLFKEASEIENKYDGMLWHALIDGAVFFSLQYFSALVLDQMTCMQPRRIKPRDCIQEGSIQLLQRKKNGSSQGGLVGLGVR